MMKKYKKVGVLIISLLMFLGLIGGSNLALAKEKSKRDINLLWYCYRSWNADKTGLEWYKEIDEEGALTSMSRWAYRYATALFLASHPRVNIEFIKSEKMWPYATGMAGNEEKWIAGLAAGEAPCTWGLGTFTGAPGSDIIEGYAADITDLVNEWDQKDFLMEKRWGIWKSAWYEGRCYGVPAWTYWWYGIAYRKERFKEAGIFDEKGNPGPPLSWTQKDFRDICLKLTDIKKKRWAFAQTNKAKYALRQWFPFFWNSGLSFVIPDKTGKYTWKSDINIPESASIWKWYHDLVWKDKVVLTSAISGIVKRGIPTDERTSMFLGQMDGYVPVAAVSRSDPSFYHMGGTPKDACFYDVIGFTNYPKGPEGVSISTIDGNNVAFNPTLSKDQLKAAFEFHTWHYGGGIGMTEQYIAAAMVRPDRKPVQTYMCTYPLPKDVLTFDEVVPEATKHMYREETKPVAPKARNFGLIVKLGSMHSALYPIYNLLRSDPNINVTKELDKMANIINESFLAYKVKDDKEKLQKYYTALDEFYAKNFPEFYEKNFKRMWEKYYKVW